MSHKYIYVLTLNFAFFEFSTFGWGRGCPNGFSVDLGWLPEQPLLKDKSSPAQLGLAGASPVPPGGRQAPRSPIGRWKGQWGPCGRSDPGRGPPFSGPEEGTVRVFCLGSGGRLP